MFWGEKPSVSVSDPVNLKGQDPVAIHATTAAPLAYDVAKVSVPPGLSGPGKAENTYGLIYGMKGMGKTILLRRLCELRAKRGGSYTFVDATGRNSDMGKVVKSPGAWWIEAKRARRARVPFRLVVQRQRGVSLNELWAAMYEVGYSLAAVDEIQNWANAYTIDPNLHELVSQGRNKLVDLWGAVRTPPEMHSVLRGNKDIAISFRMPSPRYANILIEEHFGDKRLTKTLTTLPKFEYLRVEEGNVTRGRLPVNFT